MSILDFINVSRSHPKFKFDSLCKVYNYHDSRACGYNWSRILYRIDGMILGREWLWHGIGLR
jgi:hypothetical protein